MNDAPVEIDASLHIGYILSRFPKLSETFILRELDALTRLGWRITVFPFIRMDEPVHHERVGHLIDAVERPGTLLDLLFANLVWVFLAPKRLLSTYGLVLSELWRHPGELVRGLIAVARGAAWARSVRHRGIMRVHAHFALHPTIAALTVANLTGIPYSFTCHAHDVYRTQDMLAVKLRRASFVIAISCLLRDQYILPRLQSWDLSKVRVVHCSVDLARYRQRALPTTSRPTTILAVARLTQMKGLCYLVDACALMLAQGMAFRCSIIGDGPLRARLLEQIRGAGLVEVVVLEGPRTEDAVRTALESATVFVQPSVVMPDGVMEGIPVSVIEAMAIGVPVVATSSGAIPELVEHELTGLLVPPRDGPALALAISRLTDDPATSRRLVENARRRIEEQFDLQKNVALLDELLRTSNMPNGAATHGRL